MSATLVLAASLLLPAAPTMVQSQTGGVITTPLGLYLRHDLAAASTGPWGDVRLGVFSQWLVFSNELGVRASWHTDPGVLALSLEGAIEPGLFIENVPSVRSLLDAPRVGHARQRLTAQAAVNLKLDSWWLYSRSTASVKLRDFVEYDPYQDIVIKDELDLEQATALFVRLAALRPLGARVPDAAHRSQLWLYAEHTVGLVFDLARDAPSSTRPNRLSAGLVMENFPARDVALNLDVFYSFADTPRPGPGVIALYGLSF